MAEWKEIHADIVERFKKKMREKGLSYRGLSRAIFDKFGPGGPCYNTVWNILHGRGGTERNISRVAEIMGISKDELKKLRDEPKKEIVLPTILNEKFKEVERSIQSTIRNLEAVKFQLRQGKNKLREAEENVAGILSFLSGKFKQIQELKSSIQSME